MKQNDILESFRARSTKLDQLRERMELLIDRYSAEDDELDMRKMSWIRSSPRSRIGMYKDEMEGLEEATYEHEQLQ